MLAFEERETPEIPEKNLSEQRRNQQQAQPTYSVDAENWNALSRPLHLPLFPNIL